MIKILQRFMLCSVIIHLFIDQGDGKWNTKDKGMLQRDIAIFRKMAENIEDDIEDFYDDYPDEEILGHNLEYSKLSEYENEDNDKTISEPLFNTRNQSYSHVSKKQSKMNIQNVKGETNVATFIPIIFKGDNKDASDEKNNQKTSWPKFETILLAIGKRYDWKNDRWIKVKDKIKISSDKQNFENIRSRLLSKHKFHYRTVKLNRGKSKRNVIIAVKAVR